MAAEGKHFVLCIGILFVQEVQTIGNDANNFLKIPTTTSNNHWLVFQLQDLDIWFFGRLPDLIIFEFVLFVAILIVPMPKLLLRLKNLFIQTHVTPWLQAQFIPLKFAIENSLLLKENWVKTLWALISHWNLGIEIARSSYNLIIRTQLVFQTRFPIVLWLLSSRSQSLDFYFFCIFPTINVTSHPLSGILSDENWQKVLFVLTFSALPPSFSLLSFFLEQTVLSLKSWNKFFYIGLGVLIDRMWQKFF